MADVTEIAPDIFRLSTYIPAANLQFCQFLVRDEEPVLFHTGMRRLFPAVRDAVATVLDPASLRWIAFSHFEADECGALREWQQAAPHARAACSIVAKSVSVDDVVALRPARPLADNETFTTGRYRFRFLQTPQVPHAWDAGLLFEETTATLFCSDLFHQNGDVEPITESDVVGRFRRMLIDYQQTPFAWYLPCATHTEATLHRLAELNPRLLATMHGSAFRGNGRQAIEDLGTALKAVLSEGDGQSPGSLREI